MDKDLQKQAYEWAGEICRQFDLAFDSPSNPLDGEALELFKELTEWGWFPVDRPFSNSVICKHLAHRKYGKLLWAKEHPPKDKMTPWQRVVGKSATRR